MALVSRLYGAILVKPDLQSFPISLFGQLATISSSRPEPLLQGNSTFHSIDDTRELCQKSVAHWLENAAVVTGDFSLEQFLAACNQPLISALFIALHELGLADDIRGQDCGKPTIHGSPNSKLYLMYF
ncbi:hypothetical protein BHMPCIPO_04817 [Ensifer sesbaniae]|nr:hypothetical protein [Ensifer sesbaniae]